MLEENEKEMEERIINIRSTCCFSFKILVEKKTYPSVCMFYPMNISLLEFTLAIFEIDFHDDARERRRNRVLVLQILYISLEREEGNLRYLAL